MEQNPVVGSSKNKIVIVFVFISTYFIFLTFAETITGAEKNAVSQLSLC